MRFAVDGKTGQCHLFLADVEQIIRHFPLGATQIRDAATVSPNTRQSFGGASTRSMTSTESTKTLSTTHARSLVGIDSVTTKHQSVASDCVFCTVAQLSGLPDAVLAYIFAEVKRRTDNADYYGFSNIAFLFNHVGVSVRDKLGFRLSRGEDKLTQLIQQSDGLFAVLRNAHCVAVDCGRRLIFDCGQPHPFQLSMEGFEACGISTDDGRGFTIRRIVLLQHKINEFHSADETALNALKDRLSKL